MAQPNNLMAQNRSTLKEFVSTIAMMSGDLSNITAPPFVLDTKSTVELPQFWADHPSIFCAPAKSEDPAERAMLVLRWYLSSLRNQNYMGRGENEGVKKPLNAFLGELFIASFEGEEDIGETKLVGEQVSHHPPITACRVWNDTHGVVAEGYTRQSITFNGNVTIQQTGHALFTLTKHDNESYLIPLPTLKVRGILTGAPYPELGGKYYITSTSGYTSVIEFSGKTWFSGGKKNSFMAKVFDEKKGENSEPLYTIKGQWNGEFTIHDQRKGEDVEIFDVAKQAETRAELTVDPIDEQDPWETRCAWKDVIDSLNKGDMPGTAKAKSKVEQGQRNMRKDDERENRKWKPVFFKSVETHPIAERLEQRIPGHGSSTQKKEKKETLGIWVFELDKFTNGHIQKPYHAELVPDNSHITLSDGEAEGRYSVDGRNSSDIWTADRSSRRESVASIYSQPSQPASRRGSVLPNSSSSIPSLVASSSTSSLHSHTSESPGPSARQSLDSPRKSSSSGWGLNDMSSMRKSLDGSFWRSNNVARDQPGPQHAQVMRKEGQKQESSGVDGVDLSEKPGVEEFLRDQYASSGPKEAGTRRMSRLRETSMA